MRGVEGGLCTPKEALSTAIDPIIVTGMGCTNRRIQFFDTNNRFDISVNFVISRSEFACRSPSQGPRGAGAGPAGAAVERRREGLGSPRGRAGAGAPLYGGFHGIKTLKIDVLRPKKRLSAPDRRSGAPCGGGRASPTARLEAACGMPAPPPQGPLPGRGARGCQYAHSCSTSGCGRGWGGEDAPPCPW